MHLEKHFNHEKSDNADWKLDQQKQTKEEGKSEDTFKTLCWRETGSGARREMLNIPTLVSDLELTLTKQSKTPWERVGIVLFKVPKVSVFITICQKK